MTAHQDEFDLTGKQSVAEGEFKRNPPAARESEARKDAATFAGQCKKILAILKGLKEAVATLSWLKAIVVSLFGMGIIYYPFSSNTKLLPDLFPQAVHGGKQFLWSRPSNSVKASFDGGCAKPSLINLLGFIGVASGLRLQYGLAPNMQDGGWGVHWADAPTHDFDASRFAHFSFWVRGASGDEAFEIGLKDTDAKEIKIESKDWIAASTLRNGVEVIIPLAEFRGVNIKSLNNVNFSFGSGHGSGNLCIGGMAFEGQSERA